MSAFDPIVGYRGIKAELERMAGILRNAGEYEAAGARVPSGLLLHGDPGVGKSLMAECLIEASGLPVFTCRKDRPDGDFVGRIRKTFDDAREASPAIAYLDDLDKFANTDIEHRNADAYVAVQSCIDAARGSGVFVLATTNNLACLPRSLVRPGRFDRRINVPAPTGRDADEIIGHYLRGRKLSGIAHEDVSMLMDGRSCAVLETVLNEALLYSVSRGEDAISRDSFMDAYLSQEVAGALADDWGEAQAAEGGERRKVSVHEAGHAVVYEVLAGRSVALVTAFRTKGSRRGTCLCRKPPECPTSFWKRASTFAALGGRAAVDIVFGIADEGSLNDLANVQAGLSREISAGTVFGLARSAQNAHVGRGADEGELDLLVSAELERRYQKTKELLASNREFLDRLSDAVCENDYLVSSDVQAIKGKCAIAAVSI